MPDHEMVHRAEGDEVPGVELEVAAVQHPDYVERIDVMDHDAPEEPHDLGEDAGVLSPTGHAPRLTQEMDAPGFPPSGAPRDPARLRDPRAVILEKHR
jgi:hypothetical protein